MNELLYFIIARDNGRTLQFPLSCKKVIIGTAVTLFSLVVLLIFTCSSFGDKKKNIILNNQVATLESQLNEAKSKQLQLAKEVTSLKEQTKQQRQKFKSEKEQLITTTVSELQERSELMEQAMRGVGVKVDKILPPITDNSGGPYIALPESSYDKLLDQADSYLNTFSSIPLGRPITGAITSRYGKRSDPLNKKKAYHSGVDIRGKRGKKIHATAEGTVLRAFYNGGYGKYVEIQHKNGYRTAYGHMKKILVKKGDKVSRGEVIGLVGNSGRSTGPHLHYEVIYNNRTVNPYKYMVVRIPKQKRK